MTGWRAGFVRSDVDLVSLERLVNDAAPLFAVIDYAETRREELERLFSRLADRAGEGRLRLVLLARSEADWWLNLLTANAKVEDALVKQCENIALSPLAPDAEARKALYLEAARAFAEYIPGSVSPQAPAFLADEAEARKGTYDPALVVLMSALLEVKGERAVTAPKIMDRILVHERGYWNRELAARQLGNDYVPAMAQGAAMLTLLGGVGSRKAAIDLCRRIPVCREGNLSGRTLRDLLLALYPKGKGCTGLEPDVLGEHLVARELDEDPGLLDVVFTDANSEQAAHALTVLDRLAQRDPEQTKWLDKALSGRLEALAETAMGVAAQTGDPIGQLLAKILEEQEADMALAQRLVPLLPKDTVALRELRVVVTRLYLARLRSVAEPKPLEVRQDIAGHSSNLAGYLSELGNREAALEAAEESEGAFRSLAKDHPDEMRPDLAMSLNNLANRLSELGRREEALERAQEAVDIRRALAEVRPDAFRSYLATSLNTLANRLSELGRREEALERAQEAAEIYRVLAEARPDAFRPNLATSLNNLATMLRELGRREEALERAQEAAETYRALAEDRPDAFRPDLAMSLNTLANRLSELGRREEALERAQEAAEIYRALAVARPDAFRPDLAMSLGALTNCLSALGKQDDALDSIKEGIATLQPLFLALPPAHAALMIKMTGHYLGLAKELGREPDAELLAPVIAKLEELRAEAGEPADTPPGDGT